MSVAAGQKNQIKSLLLLLNRKKNRSIKLLSILKEQNKLIPILYTALMKSHDDGSNTMHVILDCIHFIAHCFQIDVKKEN